MKTRWGLTQGQRRVILTGSWAAGLGRALRSATFLERKNKALTWNHLCLEIKIQD